MITKYITIRVDFNTDDEEQATEWANDLSIVNNNMTDEVFDIQVCGINQE